MGWQFLTNYGVERGVIAEVDLLIPDATLMLFRNNDHTYGQVQYWAAIMAQDYELHEGSPVIYNSILCYRRGQTLRFSSGNGSSMQPAIWVPRTHPAQYVAVSIFSWVP